jgi:hypothetical protein
VFENKVLRRIYGLMRQEETGGSDTTDSGQGPVIGSCELITDRRRFCDEKNISISITYLIYEPIY